MFRPWQEGDFQQIWNICNLHDQVVDPEFAGVAEEEIRDELNGFYDEVFAEVYETDGLITDLVTAQIDKTRNRIEIDVFGLPENHDYDRSIQHAIAWSKKNYPDYELRGSCNQRDAELNAANERAGLRHVRTYWTMLNPNPEQAFPKLPEGVTIRVASFESEREIWHKLLMDSFADHYGFKPQSFAQWDAKQRKMSLQDPAGVFFLEENSEPVGLLVCTDHKAESNGGFIDKLGVIPGFRGKGYGELLLRWGCAYSVSKGYGEVSLGVDSGNSSGAVDLYRKVGFRPQNAWLAFSDTEAL